MLQGRLDLIRLLFQTVWSLSKSVLQRFRQDLKWSDHIDNVTAKAAKRLYLLRELRRAGVSCNDLVLFYCSAIRSVLE